MQFSGLYLIFLGKAKANWSTRSGKSTQYHEGLEVYINTKTYLFGRENGEQVVMPAGTYRYNFEIDLHPNLPASMSFNHGEIKYTVEARLDIPWAFDKEIKVEFKVARMDDYNNNLALKQPCVKEYEIDTCGPCRCSTIPIQATVSIPHSVFTPGSKIPITLHLENPSSTDVQRIHFKLKQNIDFNRS